VTNTPQIPAETSNLATSLKMGGAEEDIQTIEVIELTDDEARNQHAHQTDDAFNIIIIGEVGQGKSSLSMALSGDDSILVKNAANGVTKAIRVYNILPELLEGAWIFDSPGVGDRDTTLADLLDHLADLCGSIDVHCVIFAIDMTKPRIHLGSQVCLLMIQKGFIKSYDHVIICGTKKDQMDEEDIEEWIENTGEEIANTFFGGLSNIAGICSVGLTMERKKEERSEFEVVDKDVDDLVQLMKKIQILGAPALYDSSFDITELAKAAGELLNLQLTEEEIEELQKKFAERNQFYHRARGKTTTSVSLEPGVPDEKDEVQDDEIVYIHVNADNLSEEEEKMDEVEDNDEVYDQVKEIHEYQNVMDIKQDNCSELDPLKEDSSPPRKKDDSSPKVSYLVLAYAPELNPDSKKRIFRVPSEKVRLDMSHIRVFSSTHTVMSLSAALTMILVLFWWWTPHLQYYVDQGMPYAFIAWTALFCLMMAYGLRNGMVLRIVLVRLYSIIIEDILIFWVSVALFPIVFFLWTLCFKPMYKIQFEDGQDSNVNGHKKSPSSFWNFSNFHMRVCQVFREICVVLMLLYFWFYKFFSFCITYCRGGVSSRSKLCVGPYTLFLECEQHLSVLFLGGEPLWCAVDSEGHGRKQCDVTSNDNEGSDSDGERSDSDREHGECDVKQFANMRNKYGLSGTLMHIANQPRIGIWLKIGLTLGVILKLLSHLFHTQSAGIDHEFIIIIHYSWSIFWAIVYITSFWALMSFESLTKQRTVLDLGLEEYACPHRETVEEKYKKAIAHAEKTYPYNVMNFIDFDETWTNVILRFSVTSWLFCIVLLFADRRLNEDGRSGTWERLQSTEQLSTFSLYIVLAPAVFFSWAPILIIVSEVIYDYCKYLKFSLLPQHTTHELWRHVAVIQGIARFRVDNEADLDDESRDELAEEWNKFGSNWQINHGIITKLNKVISRYLLVMFILVILGSILALMQLIAVVFDIDWYEGKIRYGYSASTILLWSSLLLLTTVYKMQLVNQIRETSVGKLKQNLIEKSKHSHLALQSFEAVIETFQNKFPIVAMVGRIQMRGFEYHFLQVIALATTFGWISRIAYIYHTQV